jgi:SAM-dependent methyltransferase
MNLFRPCFKPAQFDVVLCNGVLHHTSDPLAGFRSLVPLVRPGGHIVIGLYNKYGRIATKLRRAIFRATGNRARWLDPYLREVTSAAKERAWFADQYQHPHESTHTQGEVLRWFEDAGLEFVRGLPTFSPADDGLPSKGLFKAVARGGKANRAWSQARQMFTGSREGGFFLMIGRKPAAAGT